MSTTEGHNSSHWNQKYTNARSVQNKLGTTVISGTMRIIIATTQEKYQMRTPGCDMLFKIVGRWLSCCCTSQENQEIFLQNLWHRVLPKELSELSSLDLYIPMYDSFRVTFVQLRHFKTSCIAAHVLNIHQVVGSSGRGMKFRCSGCNKLHLGQKELTEHKRQCPKLDDSQRYPLLKFTSERARFILIATAKEKMVMPRNTSQSKTTPMSFCNIVFTTGASLRSHLKSREKNKAAPNPDVTKQHLPKTMSILPKKIHRDLLVLTSHLNRRRKNNNNVQFS